MAQDALYLARLRPISQLSEAKSAIGRNNSLVNGVCRQPPTQPSVCSGTSRRFMAQQFDRFRSDADIQQAAPTDRIYEYAP